MSRREDPSKDLPFTVSAHLQDGTFYRWISKNVHISLGHAAFDLAKTLYKNDRLILKHGSLVVADTGRPEG